MQKSFSFDGQHVLEFDDATHRYTLDGKRVVGATTIGSAYPKGEGLIRWMIEQGIDEYVNKTKLKAASSIGDVVHDYAYCIEKKKPFDMTKVQDHPDAATIKVAMDKVDKYISQNGDEIVMAEDVIASPKLMVAGKLDTLRRRKGKLIVGDYKTSKSIYISALHQTVLYKLMLKEWHNIDIDAVEIAKFGKSKAEPLFETCYVDADSMVINGTYYEYPGIMAELEKQTIRNVQTYRHQTGPDNFLYRRLKK